MKQQSQKCHGNDSKSLIKHIVTLGAAIGLGTIIGMSYSALPKTHYEKEKAKTALAEKATSSDFLDLKNLDRLVENLDDANPADYEALNKKGMLHYERNEFEKARDCFFKALCAKEDYVPVWYNLGVMYLRENLFDEAINAFTKALKIDPKMTDAKRYLDIAFYKAKLRQQF